MAIAAATKYVEDNPASAEDIRMISAS